MIKKSKQKGFTLIELLAVIVILGILLMTAIPAITKNIAKSRRNTYWQNAKSYIKGVATPFLAGEYVKSDGTICTSPAPGNAVIIPLDQVELEQGSTDKSSFNSKYQGSDDTLPPTIAIVNKSTSSSGERDKLVWYFAGLDKAGNGIDKFTSEADLGLSSVKTGVKNGTCSTVCSDSIVVDDNTYRTVGDVSTGGHLDICKLPE